MASRCNATLGRIECQLPGVSNSFLYVHMCGEKESYALAGRGDQHQTPCATNRCEYITPLGLPELPEV